MTVTNLFSYPRYIYIYNHFCRCLCFHGWSLISFSEQVPWNSEGFPIWIWHNCNGCQNITKSLFYGACFQKSNLCTLADNYYILDLRLLQSLLQNNNIRVCVCFVVFGAGRGVFHTLQPGKCWARDKVPILKIRV
jgi:hypothetical protein